METADKGDEGENVEEEEEEEGEEEEKEKYQKEKVGACKNEGLKAYSGLGGENQQTKTKS